jgi:hypothetical protein
MLKNHESKTYSKWNKTQFRKVTMNMDTDISLQQNVNKKKEWHIFCKYYQNVLKISQLTSYVLIIS